eukprot:CAMPEP_0197042382 /NCGR_PEP_ID=MMETSP1384-20130603/18772_1 /TAXON_ID=29189 /ORGANISM="Ammonia sp." /LENGTH=68 /DNA_ID=CAMNT_0042473475 /DNA_START=211 /DNA_END=417 /DNA_ORIENTATION=-
MLPQQICVTLKPDPKSMSPKLSPMVPEVFPLHKASPVPSSLGINVSARMGVEHLVIDGREDRALVATE